MTVETPPGPHGLLVAFSLIFSPGFGISYASKMWFSTWYHTSSSPTSTLANTSRKTSVYMHWQSSSVHVSVLSFLGFVPLKGTRRNLPFTEHLLWARQYIYYLCHPTVLKGGLVLLSSGHPGKLRLKDIKLYCVLVRANQRNGTNGKERET